MLDRQTLNSAIRMGVRKSEGKTSTEVVQSVMDAIDIAMELNASYQEVLAAPLQPTFSQPSPSQRVERTLEIEPPPPNMAAMTTEVPGPALEPSMIVMPTEGETSEAIADYSKKQELRVRSMFVGKSKPKVTLMALMEWASIKFPMQIKIVPRGREEEITLDRSLYSIPFVGDNKNNERESTIKVSYKHPALSAEMECGKAIRVADVQEEFPNVPAFLEGIKDQARELYKVRPQRIEGFAPAGPDLSQQHRMMMSAARGAQRPSMPISFADSDVSARPDVKVVE